MNASTFNSSSDIIALKDYVFKGVVPAAEHGCMDLDDHAGVTVRDICWLGNYVSGFGWDLDCEIDHPAMTLGSNAANQLLFNNLVPPGATSVTVYLDVATAFRSQGVSLVARVTVDGQTPQLSGATFVSDADGWTIGAFGDSSSADVPPGYVMGGAFDPWYFGNPPAGRYPLGRVNLEIPSSPAYREITFELVESPSNDNTSMILDEVMSLNAWELNLQPWVVDLTGDANNDRVLTAADVIWLVNYVFKAGKTPYPVPATGDVDCSASVTSSDIIKLVNHVFKSGSPPCDVASICTINLDQWTCP